jgi:dihydrofolate synthase/folylpolyglutamate synthase
LTNLPSAKFDLAQVRVLLAAMGDPHRRFRSVLIAGTNGKGSTASTLDSILRAAGHRTALYTSPHLVRVNERIRLDGEPISDAEFTGLYERVEDAAKRLVAAGDLPWHPSFFEMLTAMAFTCFAERQVDIAVLEVGMGGRLDATNVVDPLVSVITDVSLDHQKFLGNTIGEIAGEKAGIIHPGGIVVTLPQHPEANQVIGNAILERGARAVSAVPYVPVLVRGSDVPGCGAPGSRPCSSGANLGDTAPFRNCYPLDVMGEQIMVDSPLVGQHQLRNVALAIATAEQLSGLGIKISPHEIETGIRQTRWPGRFQVLPAAEGRPEMVLDVAHNPAGAWALRAALSERYPDRPLTFVFGVMRDKAMREIAEILFPLAHEVITVRANNPRAASAEEIRAIAQRITTNIACEATVGAAVARACKRAAKTGVVVITGSIYIVGEAMARWEQR